MFKTIKNFFVGNDFLYIWLPVSFFLLVGAFVVFMFFSSLIFQTYPFGPESQEIVKVERMYVDVSGERSNYMVATDKGIFEMDNSVWLQIFNIDELYGRLEAGKTYEVTVKGRKLLNFFFQRYPHITTMKEIK